jgi:acetyltransferase
MLDPKTIALIGASEDEGTTGRAIMENLARSQGRKLFPVNPGHDSVLGLDCVPSIGEVAERVDLAVVATSASTVPDVLLECAQAGVRGALVLSSGFDEPDLDDIEVGARIKEMLHSYPMRVMGPNSLGIIRPSVDLNASLLDVRPKAGNIALISQSDAVGIGMLDWAMSAGVGLSLFASTGSMADVEFADFVDFLGEDRYTRSILIFMESIGHARQFMSAARSFARSKPIIVLKPGRYPESVRAALSHTGLAIGDDEVYEAALKRVGVLRVEEIADLFHAADVLDSCRLPLGPRVAIVTNAGGLGVMATDSLVEHGGRLADLSDETAKLLDASLSSRWSGGNPIGVPGDATSEQLVAAVKACSCDPEVNGVLLLFVPQGSARPDELAMQLAHVIKCYRKPVITVLMGGETVRAGREILHAAAAPCYDTPEEAVRTYFSMYQYARNLEQVYETPAELPIDIAPPKHNLKALLRRVQRSGRTVLTEEESKRFIATYGFPVTPATMTDGLDEALAAAREIGYPVVLKIVSHDITHKSAVGGVEVGVCSPADLKRAYARMLKRVKQHAPEALIEGVSVNEMVRKVDYELILGMKKDRQFGSVVVFGAGGVGAEGLADFAVGLPPLNQTLARKMMEETRIFRTIQSPRPGIAAPQVGELEELLTVLSNIVVDFPEIAEIDINPVVISDGKPCAVDARIVIDADALTGQSDYPHLVITPYPTRYVVPWRLTDGTEVMLRPIRPEDEPMEYELLTTVSEQTLRGRFLGNVTSITHEMLVRFTNIDYDREMAIVAELSDGKSKRLIGVARLTIEAGRESGEFAVLVHDEFQKRGLGLKLTDMMIGIAQEKGLSEVSGYVDSDNRRMLRVVAGLGFVAVDNIEGVTTVRLSLK